MKVLIENVPQESKKFGLIRVTWLESDLSINPTVYVHPDEWAVYVNYDGSLTLDKLGN